MLRLTNHFIKSIMASTFKTDTLHPSNGHEKMMHVSNALRYFAKVPTKINLGIDCWPLYTEVTGQIRLTN